MSSFLELVQDVARQSGTLAGGVTLLTVQGASGRADKIVYWVKRAWEDIQNQRDWDFAKSSFEQPLLIGVSRYTPAAFDLSRFKKWAVDTAFSRPMTLYDTATGRSDEMSLRHIRFDDWRARYDRGTHEPARPIEYAVSPTRELCFGPKPDKAYTVRGDYWKSPQILSANNDVPEAPNHLHQIIVHRAIVLMGQSDESPMTIATAQNEYRRLFVSLCEECLPDIGLVRGFALA